MENYRIQFRTDGFINIVDVSNIDKEKIYNEKSILEFKVIHEKVTLEFYKKLTGVKNIF